jgi:TetR/AcrR family transcriptional regulator, ethionamide resistance regulator
VNAVSPSSASRRRAPTKGDLKERAILQTAERLLAQKSLAEIGVDELARGAGISRPAFYFYFESKNAVLRALVEGIADEAYAASEWLSRTDQPPRDVIKAGIEAGARLWQEHGPVLRAAADTWGLIPELQEFWQIVVTRFVEASAAQIERERKSGIAPPSPPSAEALATVLIRMNERCYYTNSLGAELAEDGELVETLTTVWLRAVYASDEPDGRSAAPA